MRRTAVGIDLGTTDVFAANVGRKGVEIVQNSVSERRTPALVSFTPRRRLVGDAAAPQLKSNYRNSCRGLKHLIGRTFDSPDVEAERLWALCGLSKADTGDVGYDVSYRDKPICVSATVCLSMLVTSIVATCKAWTKMDVREVVFAIPSYFTEPMRQACLDAIRIAGVQCLRLLHESTALALAWRFETQGFEDSTPIIVAFCSAGHSGLCVAVARYEKGAISILGEAYDRSVSGQRMDKAIIDIFVESLKKQGAPNPLASAKSLLKLEEAATKVKKTISVVDEAKGVAECVVEDFDLSCDVKRDKFEEACSYMNAAAAECVTRALAAAELTVQDIRQIEVVGGCSRIPFVQRALKQAFEGRELTTSLNADEAVAKGCAWAAAMLSPSVRLAPLPLKESGTPAVALEWKDCEAIEAEGSEVQEGGRRRLLVFEAQAGPGAEAEVNVRCRGALELTAVSLVKDGEETILGTWKLDFPGKEMHEVELQCAIDLNGLFSVSKAAVCTGKEQAEAEAKAAAEVKAKEEEEAKAKAEAEAAVAKEKAEEEAKKAGEEGETKKEGEEEDVKKEVEEGETQKEGEEEEAEKVSKPDEAEEGSQAEKVSKPDEAEEGSQAEGAVEEPPAAQGEASKEEGKKEPKEEAEQAAEADEGAKKEDGQPEEGKGKEEPQENAEEPFEVDMGRPKDGGGADKPGGFNWRFWQWGRGSKDSSKDGDQPAEAATSAQQKRKVGGGAAKTVVKRQNVAVQQLKRDGFNKEAMAEAVEAELQYRATEQAVTDAEKSRNDFEAYIFELRNKLSSGDALIVEYASFEERNSLSTQLEQAETWAYDNTEEEAGVYVTKLKALRKAEKECSNRKAGLDAIDEKVKVLKASVRKYKATAISPIYDYIAKEKLESITGECDGHTQWIGDLEKKQAELKKWEAPAFSVAELTIRNSALTSNATKILSEAKPKPPEPPKEEKEGEKDKDGKDSGEGKKKGKKGDKEKGGDAGAEDRSKAADAKADEKAAAEAAAAAAAASKRRRWLVGGLSAAVALPAIALLAGLGQPYGLPSPLAPWLGAGGDADFDDAVPELADEAEEPAEDL